MIQFDSSMADTLAARISNTFSAAGWSDDTTRWAALRAGDVATAEGMIAMARNVPERVRNTIMRDKALTTAGQVIQALEISGYVQLAVKNCAALPEHLRSPRAYITREGTGERPMSVKEAREAFVSAMAAADQHIDTSRPADSSLHALQAAVTRQYGPGVSVHGRGEGRPLVGDAFAQSTEGRK